MPNPPWGKAEAVQQAEATVPPSHDCKACTLAAEPTSLVAEPASLAAPASLAGTPKAQPASSAGSAAPAIVPSCAAADDAGTPAKTIGECLSAADSNAMPAAVDESNTKSTPSAVIGSVVDADSELGDGSSSQSAIVAEPGGDVALDVALDVETVVVKLATAAAAFAGSASPCAGTGNVELAGLASAPDAGFGETPRTIARLAARAKAAVTEGLAAAAMPSTTASAIMAIATITPAGEPEALTPAPAAEAAARADACSAASTTIRGTVKAVAVLFTVTTLIPATRASTGCRVIIASWRSSAEPSAEVAGAVDGVGTAVVALAPADVPFAGLPGE